MAKSKQLILGVTAEEAIKNITGTKTGRFSTTKPNISGMPQSYPVNKHKEGKIKLSLLLPRFALAIARARMHGLKKNNYSPNSWKKVPDEDLLDAILRHVNAYQRGEILDESGEHHLSHAAANCGFIVEKYETKKEKQNDRRQTTSDDPRK